MENVQSGVCKEECINIDAGSGNRAGGVPRFVDGSALEHAGQDGAGGTNDDEDHASPDNPAEGLLDSKTEVEGEYCYLRHCYADVVYDFAKVIELLLELVLSMLSLVGFTSSEALKLVSGGKS